MNQMDLIDCHRIERTLPEVRKELRAKLDDGTTCPCCGQYVKRYRRKFNSGMARSLIWLVRRQEETGKGWIDVPKEAPRNVLRSREFGKLALWGMVKTVEAQPPDSQAAKKHSGLWTATTKGLEFVGCCAMIHSHAVIYNNRVERFEGELIDIRQALGKRFDYRELMEGGIDCDSIPTRHRSGSNNEGAGPSPTSY